MAALAALANLKGDATATFAASLIAEGLDQIASMPVSMDCTERRGRGC